MLERVLIPKLLLFILILFPHLAIANNFSSNLVNAALERTKHKVHYDGRYFGIPYPNGDIPQNLGVCTDVVIRSYRKLGVDLQQLLHEDIKDNFRRYPSNKIWGLNRPDTNIDHRRVPNLQVFFTRNGVSLPPSSNPEDYAPGDLVTWMLPGNLPHIGIVTDKHDTKTNAPLIVHNIGNGPVLENMLFKYHISGHYRYTPRIDP
jgi:uncharacterized protein YijF (DUF1287 family)